MNKRIISSIFLLVFLSQVVGFTIFFNHEKSKIRKELKLLLKEGVPENQYINFMFSPKQYAKLKFIKKNEFKIRENYYDIVFSKMDKKGNILLKCVNDIQETNLFKNLTENINFNLGNESNKSPLKIVFSIVEKPFISLNSTIEIFKLCFSEDETKYFSYNFVLEESLISFVSPPPQNFI